MPRKKGNVPGKTRSFFVVVFGNGFRSIWDCVNFERTRGEITDGTQAHTYTHTRGDKNREIEIERDRNKI